MKNYWFMFLLLIGCCLASPNEVRAQTVYAHSDIAYYEPTNSILAYTEAWSDYSTELYYCLYVSGPVYKDGVEQAWLSGNNYPPGGQGQCGGWANADTWLPYDPNAEYQVVTDNYLGTTYRSFDETGYEDYYNYSYYGALSPTIYYPASFGFSGGGPPNHSPAGIFLGTIYAIFTQGASSGPPHHLKVVNDVITTETCYQKVREITYKIVDSNGRRAGGVAIKEIFPGPIHNSCNTSDPVPDPCNSDYIGQPFGNFTDRLTTGCPTLGGDCGFTTDPDRWAWCSPIGVTILARILYDVRYTYINVNGDTSPWSFGSEFYP